MTDNRIRWFRDEGRLEENPNYVSEEQYQRGFNLPGTIINIGSPADVPVFRGYVTPPHMQSPATTLTPVAMRTPPSPLNLNTFEEINFNMIDELREEINVERHSPQPPQPPPLFDKKINPLFLTAGAAVSAVGAKLLYNRFVRDSRRNGEVAKQEMTDEHLSEMALYKDMIQVQYDNRKSSGRDAPIYSLAEAFTDRFVYPNLGATDERSTDFTSSSRSRVAESTLKDNRKLDVEDFKFIESGDLFALFGNEKTGKRVLAIRGLMPNIDSKDALQLPNMIKQTVFKKNNDVDLQYKRDYNAIEDYLLSLPNYKDVTVTGHSRGGATALQLARTHTLEAHVFQPVTVGDIEKRDTKAGTLVIEDEGSTLKVKRRHIYTNAEDYTPSNLVNPNDTRETRYVLDYDGYNIPLVQSLDAHQLHHFHKDATGYVLQQKDDFAINRMMEEDARELGYNMDDDDIPYDEDLYEMVYGSKEDINYNEEEYEDANEYIIPTTREMVFHERPFIPNNRQSKLDTNGDGIVSYAEFLNYYKKLGYNTNQIKKMFRSLDRNKDGVLSKNEFN